MNLDIDSPNLFIDHPLPWRFVPTVGQVFDATGKVVFTILVGESQIEAVRDTERLISLINSENELIGKS